MASAFIPSLKSKIKTTYETGTRAGDILFTPSDVHILTDNGIDVRVCLPWSLKL